MGFEACLPARVTFADLCFGTFTFTVAASDRLKRSVVGLPLHFFCPFLHLRPPVAETFESAGGVVSAPPGPFTTTLPVMKECTLQKYVNVPGVLKVCEKVSV